MQKNKRTKTPCLTLIAFVQAFQLSLHVPALTLNINHTVRPRTEQSTQRGLPEEVVFKWLPEPLCIRRNSDSWPTLCLAFISSHWMSLRSGGQTMQVGLFVYLKGCFRAAGRWRRRHLHTDRDVWEKDW